jgi:hypothetical protein
VVSEDDDDDDDDDDDPAADIPSCTTPPARHGHSSPPLLCLPTTDEVEDHDTSDDEMGEEVVVEEQEVVVEQEEVVEEQDVADEVMQREKKIEDAVKHVKMARAQRQLVNEKMDKAKEDALANTIHSERVHTFIVDYGQNMALPWFGTSQPGDTYYYTPLTVFNLGVVDVSHPDGEHLYYSFFAGVFYFARIETAYVLGYSTNSTRTSTLSFDGSANNHCNYLVFEPSQYLQLPRQLRQQTEIGQPHEEGYSSVC